MCWAALHGPANSVGQTAFTGSASLAFISRDVPCRRAGPVTPEAHHPLRSGTGESGQCHKGQWHCRLQSAGESGQWHCPLRTGRWAAPLAALPNRTPRGSLPLVCEPNSPPYVGYGPCGRSRSHMEPIVISTWTRSTGRGWTSLVEPASHEDSCPFPIRESGHR